MSEIDLTPCDDVAYSYLRFSSLEQEQGDSVRRQLSLRDAWLTRNNVPLDTSLNLQDRGVSGYRGKHRSNPDRYALAAFLRLVEQGRIRPGSYLIVESLDRLSREDIIPALTLFLNLIQAGIRIVQLLPTETVYDSQSSPMHLMMALMELSRGNSESKVKSERVGAKWGRKKALAQAGQEQESSKSLPRGFKIMTRRLPAWIREENGKAVLIPERAAAVKYIYQLAAAGLGVPRIIQRLQAEGIQPFGEHKVSPGRKRSAFAGRWVRSYVNRLLDDRRTLGELQPCKSGKESDKTKAHHGRPKDGEAIQGYFPAVVTEDEFNAARAACKGREVKSQPKPSPELSEERVRQLHEAGRSAYQIAQQLGATRARVYRVLTRLGLHKPQQRSGPRDVYLWEGMLTDARTGTPYWRVAVSNAGSTSLYPAAALDGHHSGRGTSFPVWIFERGLLDLLREVDPREILAGVNGHDKLARLEAELAHIEAELAQLAAALDRGFSITLENAAKRWEARKAELLPALQQAQREAAHPLSAGWTECQGLLAVLDNTPAEAMEETRCRLRSALRRIISSISLLVVARGDDRLCAVQVWFVGGERHRDYLLLYRRARANRPAAWWSCSLALVTAAGDLDLRRREDAEALAALLAETDLDELTR
jgi:DNA invertase Pin-like site-specific DNA recombinase